MRLHQRSVARRINVVSAVGLNSITLRENCCPPDDSNPRTVVRDVMYLPGRLDKRAPGGVLTRGALALNVVLLRYSANGEKHIALPLVVVPPDGVPWSHSEPLDHDESRLRSNVLTIYCAKVIVVESCSRLKKYIGECKGRPGQQGQDRGH